MCADPRPNREAGSFCRIRLFRRTVDISSFVATDLWCGDVTMSAKRSIGGFRGDG